MEAAREHYSRCLDLASARDDAGLASEARAGLAVVETQRTLDEQSDPELALTVLDQALQDEPVAPWLSCEKGQIALEYGLHEAAAEAFEVCLEANRGDEGRQKQARVGLAQSRGFIAYETGDAETALAHFREWADLVPDEPWPQCTMGDVLNWDLERYEEALAAYERCAELAQSNDDETWARENMALVQASMALGDERWDEAIAHYGEAISISPDAAYLYCERGDLYLELGDVQNGRPDVQTCLELSGDDEGLRQWAEELLQKAEEQP
jgi:tetratricopeptide (TPR) repeat protein